jgi:hypothetical protein
LADPHQGEKLRSGGRLKTCNLIAERCDGRIAGGHYVKTASSHALGLALGRMRLAHDLVGAMQECVPRVTSRFRALSDEMHLLRGDVAQHGASFRIEAEASALTASSP